MKQLMKALVKEQRSPGLILTQVPIPTYGEDEVLVRVKAASICGTDLHIYNWDDWAAKTVQTPNIIGHEFSGLVVGIGKMVTNTKMGDHVTAEGHHTCGTCRLCRTGYAHVCPNTLSLGITMPGCFAEYVVVKASNLIINDHSIPHELVCLQDPLGNAVQSVLAGDIVGKTVGVIGVGPIGLMCIIVAKACGAGKVVAVDIQDYRLDMAKRLGADAVINSANEPLPETARRLTNGEGFEVLLEMSGHPQAIRDGLNATAHAGRVSLLGIPTREVSLDLSNHIIFKGIRLEGITGRRMYETWHQLQGLLRSERINLSPLLTHRMPLERYEEAFEIVRSGRCGKVVFEMNPDYRQESDPHEHMEIA
jgi:threonine 3-dehydrogenase